MRVVVTGGAGFIGSHVADALLERGDQVLVIDDLSTGDRANLNPQAGLEELDVRSPDAAATVRLWRPQAISHHAAQMSVSRSVREPLYDAEVNVLGSLNLLEAARAVGRAWCSPPPAGRSMATPTCCPRQRRRPPGRSRPTA